jgi:hypothetical protein
MNIRIQILGCQEYFQGLIMVNGQVQKVRCELTHIFNCRAHFVPGVVFEVRKTASFSSWIGLVAEVCTSDPLLLQLNAINCFTYRKIYYLCAS